MPLATVDDVAARMGQPVSPEESPRISAFIDDVTGLIEDYCGRDLARREDQELTLYPDGSPAYWMLPIPPRYQTYFTVSAVERDGEPVEGWSLVKTSPGFALCLAGEYGDATWGTAPVTVTASWGYPTPPAALRAVTCAEVMRWLSVAPGVQSEKVGDVEVTYSGASSTQTLSALTRAALRPYRRRGLGVISLRREGHAPSVY